MKRMFFLISVMLLVFPTELGAQQNGILTQALQWESQGDWATAAAYYEEYLSSRAAGETEACWHYAHCLRLLYEYQQAENMYLRVWRQDSLHYPDALFYLALSRKSNAEYAEAGRLFARYAKQHAGDTTRLLSRARMETQACAWARQQLEKPQPYELYALPPKVNSPYSESNAFAVGDSLLYFTSLKSMTDKGNAGMLDGYYAARLYRAHLTSEGVGKVEALPAVLNHPQYHNANLCFNKAHTRLYMTRSRVTEAAAGKGEIWSAEYRDGRWQKPVRLGAPVNLPGTVSTQPCVVETEGVETLYFVSDRKGGCGGTDLWYAFREEDGQFRSAVNLGRVVNTPGNEQTPFYDEHTGTLYFSSDALPGMGGYDVFASQGGLNVWTAPRNLSWPINSPANEVYFTCDSAGMSGYFASNRAKALALTDAACCNDIYHFEKEMPQIRTFADTVFCKARPVRSTQASAQAASMLPLRLYFHNDEPDARSTADTTDLDYHTTLSLYLAMRSLYVSEYTSGLNGKAAEVARGQIEEFFTDSLSRRYAALLRFFSLLEEDLRSGSRVTLTVDGHASPLFSDSYNMHLSSRRIRSLWNSLVEYRQGIFLPYLKSGQLRFISDPKGKQQAGRNVSDNPNDRRNSVYSLAAALERRIQITGYVSEPVKSTIENNGCVLPDTALVFHRKEGIDRYTYYIELKNAGEDAVQVEKVEAPAGLEVQVEKKHLPAQSGTFLSVSFDASVFDIRPESRVKLFLRTSQENFCLPLRITYFRQK